METVEIGSLWISKTNFHGKHRAIFMVTGEAPGDGDGIRYYYVTQITRWKDYIDSGTLYFPDPDNWEKLS